MTLTTEQYVRPDFSSIVVRNITEIQEYSTQNKIEAGKLLRLFGFSMEASQIDSEIRSGENDTLLAHNTLMGELGFNNESPSYRRLYGQQDSILKKAFSLSAGICEGYTIGSHSAMVVNIFERYMRDRFEESDSVNLGQFRIFLALHDSGKGFAVKEEGNYATKLRKQKELTYCRDIIQTVGTQLAWSRASIRVFKSLLVDDTIGDYLKGEISANEAKAQLKKNTPESMTLEKFASLMITFHRCDAASYKFLRGINLIDLSGDTLEYAINASRKISQLFLDLTK